ncbi:N-acetylglucosamine kinase [Nonomuraea endophytica]|uniref:N-acetylglucosamine kinase-like BadF-type ATPase n=1 Tax=Nonomuraea endophytica TaxID=714136 RepID=A0A7W8A965_9ACTN|nr:BadF/BadG/BcrA/BcrD ATPase family protein [Nonomuraea endophytica]MBB5080553.1 N-acetylglucosamine kinase-like BadF-type ATPase [Nonomuraea endophytica]
MTHSLVVGVDAGATSTRVAVHTLDGERVGYARAGAGNPTAHGAEKAVANIAAALREALASADASAVAGSLAGIAGKQDIMDVELARLWAEHGIPKAPEMFGDVAIAYVAGSPAADGSLLLSGTGAIAARISGYRQAVIADGLGWLLGDAGSGFWIGRAAAKAVVQGLDRGEPAGELSELVLTHFLGAERGATPRATADRIVRLAQADHMCLAALAALVSQAASAGDPMAVKIAREAAGQLVATVRRLHTTGPVVLAGSVLTNPGPVRQAVRELLGDTPVRTARDAAGAAAWLAARDLLGSRAVELHERFVATS